MPIQVCVSLYLPTAAAVMALAEKVISSSPLTAAPANRSKLTGASTLIEELKLVWFFGTSVFVARTLTCANGRFIVTS